MRLFVFAKVQTVDPVRFSSRTSFSLGDEFFGHSRRLNWLYPKNRHSRFNCLLCPKSPYWSWKLVLELSCLSNTSDPFMRDTIRSFKAYFDLYFTSEIGKFTCRIRTRPVYVTDNRHSCVKSQTAQND